MRQAQAVAHPTGQRLTAVRRYGLREAIDGYVFAAPAILGLFVFTLGPILVSFYYSLSDYNIMHSPQFIGLGNYTKLIGTDALFRKSLGVTLYFSALSIPLNLASAFLVALLMNQKVRGIAVYRTLWYVPSLVPAVASATLWRWILNRDFGLLNNVLAPLGLGSPGWLVDPSLTVPSLVIMGLWGVGNTMLIFLAGLQGIPGHLYEAAEIDGAGPLTKFRHVTIPMVSSIIFFNLIMGVIGSFQVFTTAFIIFGGGGTTGSAGPQNAALFYVLYLYRNAFAYMKMGYASAMAWILFAIIMVLTAILFRFQSSWVYYEAGTAR